MKKNKMMRAASFLLVAVLLTTSVISGTFAKYVTSANATDSARVAKWGVDFVVSSDLFKTSYATDDGDYSTIMSTSVLSGSGDVVAPGTSGTGYSFATDGAIPEVSYRVTFAETTGTNYKDIYLDSYHPVKFTLTFNGDTIGDAKTSLADVMTNVAKCTYYYDVQTGKYHVSIDNGNNWATEQASAPTLTIDWEWEYSVDADTDAKDTILGDLVAGEDNGGYSTGYGLEVAFDITATATQID